MKFIQWLKQTRHSLSQIDTVNEWQRGMSPNDLLSQSIYMGKLRELNHLISATPSHYLDLYLKPLQAFAGLAQKLPHPHYPDYDKAGGLLLAGIERAIAALKFRRGYMLPLGADTETCYREQDAWTYAIFSAALLQDCWLVLGAFQVTIKDPHNNKVDLWQPLAMPRMMPEHDYRFNVRSLEECWRSANPLLIKSILTERAFQWLCSYPLLFPSWWNNITGRPLSEDMLHGILQRAESIVFKKNNEKLSEAKSNETPQQQVQTDNQIVSIAEKLIDHVKQKINQRSLEVNQSGSFIHRVAEGILLIMPNAIESLLSQHPELKNNIEISTNESIDEALWKSLTESGQFIKNGAQNTFLHHYFIGRWEDRNIVRGLLLPCEVLFSADEMPRINDQLHQESIL